MLKDPAPAEGPANVGTHPNSTLAPATQGRGVCDAWDKDWSVNTCARTHQEGSEKMR